MKKEMILLFVFVVAATVFWCTPRYFPKSEKNIASIEVFNGTTGTSYKIDDADDIDKLLTGLRAEPLRKSGISLFRMGYSYRISFLDGSERVAESFMINSSDRLRKDPFFYDAKQLPIDLLEKFEVKYTGIQEDL